MSKVLIDRELLERAVYRLEVIYDADSPIVCDLSAVLATPSGTPAFALGDTVRKTKGSQWHGTVVGTYSTALTPEGYAVESSTEKGSVQIYPAGALERVTQEPRP